MSNESNDPREIEVPQDDDGQRMDRWLKRVAPDLSYVLVQKLIRKGQIRMDGGRVKTSTPIKAGSIVRLPPYRGTNEKGPKHKREYKISSEDEAFIRSLVIYDDGDVVALNKPPGLAVQGGSKTTRHIDGLLEGLKNEDGVKPRLVHRLDKDTSGVLLLARSAKVAKEMGALFKGRDIRKLYWAIVTPTPDIPAGSIKAPIGKGGGVGREKMYVNEEEGKFALTEYTVVEQALNQAAFVAFWPRTGRTHQIRVHAQILGSPVLGDGKYGGADARIEGLEHHDNLYKGLHLHARRIRCKHPVKKGWLDITAPLPPELVRTWKTLGFNHKHKEDPFADLD